MWENLKQDYIEVVNLSRKNLSVIVSTNSSITSVDKPIKTGTDSFSFVGPQGNPQVPDNGFATVEVLQAYSDENTFSTENPAIFETEPKEAIDLDIYYEASKSYPIDHSDLSSFNQAFTLDYFNCFSFANGVESNRIRDDFNTMTIAKGVKASATRARKALANLSKLIKARRKEIQEAKNAAKTAA